MTYIQSAHCNTTRDWLHGKTNKCAAPKGRFVVMQASVFPDARLKPITEPQSYNDCESFLYDLPDCDDSFVIVREDEVHCLEEQL